MHVGIATGFANHFHIDDARFIREEVTQLLMAEPLGFESIWMTEHHFSSYSVSPNPLQYLTWLAGQTKRMRLGTQVIVAPWHDPVRVAEQIAVLDHLSGGRVIAGFGRGLARHEYEGLRIDQNEARERYDEVIELVMGAMETGFIEGGEIFKQPRREIRPRPIRSLRGRAFTGGGTPASMAASARLGLGRLFLAQPESAPKKSPLATATSGSVQEDAPKSPDEVWLEAWKQAWPDVPPPAPFVSNLVFVDESADRALEVSMKYMAVLFKSVVDNYEMRSEHHGTIKGYETYKPMRVTDEELDAIAAASGRNSIHGTPQQVLEKLDEVVKLREPQGMMPHLWTGGMPHEEAVRNMRLFADKCLREVQSWQGAPSTIDEPLAQAAE